MFVVKNGISFHAQVLGPRPEDAGNRHGEVPLESEKQNDVQQSIPPSSVVMLHGLLVGSLASWYFTAAPALARSRRVFLYDLRGHGKSEKTLSGYSVAAMANDLAALSESFDSNAMDVVGHSFGALVALRFALNHPSRVRKVVLVEAPLPPSSFREIDQFLMRSPEEMAAALPEQWRAMTGGGRRGSRFAESLKFLIGESSLVNDLKAEVDIADSELRGFEKEVLCVYGERSSCRPVGDRLVRAFPKGKLVVLDGGHYLHLDKTAELTDHIVEFLNG